MARMSIDDMILRDPRVMRLAKLCGIGKHDAIGRLLAVFAITYDRVTDVIDPIDIDIAAELEGFAEHMIAVELGAPVRGGVRIRGAKQRIKYLNDLAEKASEAGRKSGEVRRKKANEKRTVPFDSGTAAVQKSNGATNVVSTPTVPDTSVSTAPVRAAPENINSIRERHPEAGRIARAVWNHTAKRHAALRSSGVDPTSPPLEVMPPGGRPGWVSLLDRVCELLVDSTPQTAEATAIRRVDVAEAAARRDATSRWFVPEFLFDAKSFAIGASMSPEQAAKPSVPHRDDRNTQIRKIQPL